MLIKSNSISLQNSKNIALSIQFSLDGFSFFAFNIDSKNECLFKDYPFKNTLNTPEELLNKIDEIFKSEPNLQLEFKKVEVIHQNNLSTIVPDAYFDEEKLSQYLNYTVKTLKNDFITYDDLSSIAAKNVYIPYININNYLFQNFGEFEYQHHTSVLIEKLIENNSYKKKVMFVNVLKNTFDIVILEDKKLILKNSFSYTTKEDFIYYILFTAEQYQLKTEDFQLYFLGDISTDSDTYKITYKFVKNVTFLESKKNIHTNLGLSKHSNYILLG